MTSISSPFPALNQAQSHVYRLLDYNSPTSSELPATLLFANSWTQDPKKTQPKTLSQQAPDCWKMLGTTFMYIHLSPCRRNFVSHSRNPDHLQSFHQKIDKILTILIKGHTSSWKIWPIPKTWTSASPLQWLVSSTKSCYLVDYQQLMSERYNHTQSVHEILQASPATILNLEIWFLPAQKITMAIGYEAPVHQRQQQSQQQKL